MNPILKSIRKSIALIVLSTFLMGTYVIGKEPLWIGFLLVAVAFISLVLHLKSEFSLDKDIEGIRKDSINRSLSSLKGQSFEKIFPYFSDFKYDTRDIIFAEKPIDFIAFNGLSEGNVTEIVFVEVKSGKSGLSKRQVDIKKAIENGNVRFETYKINE